MKHELYRLRGPLVALAGLCFFLLGIYLLAQPPGQRIERQRTETVGEQIRTGKAPIPEFTDETKAMIEKHSIFQALASYTDTGFEPTTIAIKRGDTVRFTNNSSHAIWIASSGSDTKIYPRTIQTCGSSDLDSCSPFPPMDFWQFRFDVAGTWEVVNNLDKSKGVMVHVE